MSVGLMPAPVQAPAELQFAYRYAGVAVDFRQRCYAVKRARDEIDVGVVIHYPLFGHVGPAAAEARGAEEAPAAFLDHGYIAGEFPCRCAPFQVDFHGAI